MSETEFAAETTSDQQPPARWAPRPLHPVAVLVTIAIAVVALTGVLAFWRLPPFGGDAETDNAYVRGRTTVVAPQVSGYVSDVLVNDFEHVHAGQVLVKIDDAVYLARVDTARANLAAALANLANSDQARASRAASLQGQRAGIFGAQAQLARAQSDMERARDLASDGSISLRERDQTAAALAQAEAQLRQAQAGEQIGEQDVRTVEVGRGGLEAQVEAARAQLEAARIDLRHTVITAPEDGRLGEVLVRRGAYVSNGSLLISVVPADRWIIADFKETETRGIKPGQPVSFVADALGRIQFHGHVELIAPATASEFSLIKPNNGTGNFVKIPQRIGVRITIDPGQPGADRLEPGMSVEVRVRLR